MVGRRSGPIAIAALSALILAVSGCSGAKAKTPDPDPYLQPVGFTEETGSVTGIVVDEEFVPLKDAIVGFIDPYQATKTDEAGHFEIGLLKPGLRNLYVIHLGHKAAGKRINITQNAPTEVTFILPVLPVEGPWVDVIQRHHRFERSINTQPISSGALTNQTGYSWIPKDDPKALTHMHMEVIWTQTSTWSGGISVVFGLQKDPGRNNFLRLDGKSPLVGDVDRALFDEVVEAGSGPCIKQPCRLAYTATSSTKVTNLPVDVGVMMDQPFDVYVAHFFRMAPPPGFTIAV